MDPAIFTSAAPGRLVPTHAGAVFVPAPLPPDIAFNEELASCLADAGPGVGLLAGTGLT